MNHQNVIAVEYVPPGVEVIIPPTNTVVLHAEKVTIAARCQAKN
jgi:hypothetical protein